MSAAPSTRCRSALSAGATLIACSLASAGGSQPMHFSYVSGASGSAYLVAPATFSFTSLTGSSYLNGTGTPAGYVTVKWEPVYGSDYFTATLNGTASSTGYLNVIFSVSLSSAVIWHNAAGLGAMAGGTWAVVGGNPLSEGDVLAAGSYSFEGTINYSGTPTPFLDVAFYLTAAPSGVPLPGAAGLAAVGLVGLSRRRRR